MCSVLLADIRRHDVRGCISQKVSYIRKTWYVAIQKLHLRWCRIVNYVHFVKYVQSGRVLGRSKSGNVAQVRAITTGDPMTAQPNMETTNSPGDTSEEEDRTYIGSTEFRKMIRKVLELVRFKDRRFVVNKHGEPQAAVVPMEDLEMLEYLENEADRQRLEELRDEDSETVSLEEFEQKFVDE